MGKNGALLRAQKMQKTTYTFTRAQLEEHDKAVIEAKKERIRADLYEQMNADFRKKQDEIQKAIDEEWHKREEMFKGGSWSDSFFLILSLLLAVSSKVLVEQFDWTPLPKDRYFTRRYRLARFADAVASEVDGICNDEMQDIRRYCEDVYQRYGVKFLIETEGEEHGKAG